MASKTILDLEARASGSLRLKGKFAVVFGAGGSIGAAVAKEFAAEGAEVFLSGRSKGGVDEAVAQITAADGIAHSAAIDACDDNAVNKYIAEIVGKAGKIDVAFNAAGPLAKDYGAGKAAVDLPIEELTVALMTVVTILAKQSE